MVAKTTALRAAFGEDSPASSRMPGHKDTPELVVPCREPRQRERGAGRSRMPPDVVGGAETAPSLLGITVIRAWSWRRTIG